MREVSGIAYRTTVSISQSNTSGNISLATDRVTKAGGLVGQASSTKISVAQSSSSANLNITFQDWVSVGGLMGQFTTEAGYTNASYQIDNVTTSGSLTIDRSSASVLGGNVGGLIGALKTKEAATLTSKTLVSSATITTAIKGPSWWLNC